MPAERQDPSVPLAEIAHGPSAFEQFLDKNQKSLLALGVLLLLGAASLVIFRGVEKGRQQAAGAALSLASGTSELQVLIDKHGGSRAASSAAVLLAEQQWGAGQQDAAVNGLRNFIDSNPGHAALPTARASLGSKLMAQGKNADAASVFQEIVNDTRSRFLVPYALINLGDLAKIAGDIDRAETYYTRARTDHPDSGFATTASERLASLRAVLPVEVDPPPALEEGEADEILPGTFDPASLIPSTLLENFESPAGVESDTPVGELEEAPEVVVEEPAEATSPGEEPPTTGEP